jgi:hypothetical protein
MRNIVFVCLLLFSGNLAVAQDLSTTSSWYMVSASETILSWGNIESPGLDTKNVARFAPFINFGHLLHRDFNQKTGFYTGVAVRNVGIITGLNDSIRLKQRVYTVGIPIAFKYGDMKGNLVAAGFDNEFAVNYKQKKYVNDEKSTTNVWFSDRTNIYLPSIFAELKSKKGNYIRFKYYLTDFLKEGNQSLNEPGVAYAPSQSTMMYISVGYMVKTRELINRQSRK